MIKIAICDDNPVVCSAIENTCLDFSNQEEIVLEIDIYYSGETLLKAACKTVGSHR